MLKCFISGTFPLYLSPSTSVAKTSTFHVTRRVNIVLAIYQVASSSLTAAEPPTLTNVYLRWCRKSSQETILSLPGKFETF